LFACAPVGEGIENARTQISKIVKKPKEMPKTTQQIDGLNVGKSV
jgi:hypothetical protein